MTLANVFISYARADGSVESLRLYDALKKEGIAVWRDNRIDPTLDFTGEIEAAIEAATHIAVIVTPDIKRADSFVRLEISYALTQKKAIIPLVFAGGHRPINIINHTYIPFGDWDIGWALLLKRLENFEVEEVSPATRREYEIAYLQKVGQAYDHWRDLYTDMAAQARIEEAKVKLKPAARKMIEMRHRVHEKMDHSLDAEKGITVKTESLAELLEGLRKYRRVALVGDPGAGKTTTLERLAYEYATAAAEESGADYRQPLPLFVRLGAYTGGDFSQFLEGFLGGLLLKDYLPQRLVLLLDGLNEMPLEHLPQVEQWLQKNPEVAVMVSCRKLDYVERKLPLQRVDVVPLDLERLRLFMSNYLEDADRDLLFWALAGHEANRVWDWYLKQKSDATYQDFFYGEDQVGESWIPERKALDRIRQQWREQQRLPDMLDVVTNPFLLQIVLEIYSLSGTAPHNKGDLFGRFVSLLLEERGKVGIRADKDWLAEDFQKRALGALAYRMQSEKTGTSVSLTFVLDSFRASLPSIKPDLVLYFALSASILEQTDSIRFSHQLLQEYFAAYEMGEDLKRGVPASKYFPSENWWTPTGWEETALLLAGILGESTTVVEWLTALQPDLAYKIARESGTSCSAKALGALYEPVTGARRSPYAVAEWGRLNHEHDSRSGIGLRADGLPDLLWCEVSAGDFLYGGQKEKRTLPYSFKMAKYLITYRQFSAFANSGDYDKAEWWQDFPEKYRPQKLAAQNNPYWNHPRDSVSWYQAVAFSRWLTVNYRSNGVISERDIIRLPTEWEWERAARGTDGRTYPWGDNYLVGYANIDEQEEGDGPYFLYCTTAVGSYPQGASPDRVLDMAGNLQEWCLNDYGNPNIIDGYNNGATKVLRGGAFLNSTYIARASYRNSDNPHDVGYIYGVRLVLAPINALSLDGAK